MKLQQLQEAKYTGAFSEDEIYDRYRDLADNLRRDRKHVMMAGASQWYPEIEHVVMEVLLTSVFLSRSQARRFIRDALKSYSLPYTSMTAKYEDGETINVQVTYKS